MKRSNKLLRLLFGAASVLSAVTLTLGGCTSVDDTLGGNLVPDNQQMRAGFVRFPESGEDKAKYVTTRLFQSDSVVSSNLSSGYFGSQLNDTLGLRTADVLQDNDSYHALEKVGGLIVTGATGTNVNDLAMVLIRR